MNRTLLLILCDFLLLTLLALTRWETAEPPPAPAEQAAVRDDADPAATARGDLADLMKLSLEDEKAQREQVSSELAATQAELDARAKALAEREAALAAARQTQAELDAALAAKQAEASQLQQKVTEIADFAATSQARMRQLQQDLEKTEAEAARRDSAFKELASQHREAQARIQDLNVAVKVAENEKSILQETAQTLKNQVVIERQERAKVQETATQLAQGVGQLAEKSADLATEIRENRPVNANTLYNEFLKSRVSTLITTSRSNANRPRSTQTVLVKSGTQTYALLHIEDSPFSFRDATNLWTNVDVAFAKDGYRTTAGSLIFLARDPRIIAIPISDEQAKSLSHKVYQPALDPFKFPEAVLISSGGGGYGEVPFKLDPESQGLVKMDNRLVRRLFGDFSPSRGDLVLSKSGELLGIMVSNDYCAIVNNFLPAATMQTGQVPDQSLRDILERMVERYRKLPYKLQ